MTRLATALVTGASRGIGFAVSRRLAHEGVRVSLLARPGQALDDAGLALGAMAESVPCDLRVASEVSAAMDALLGRTVPDIVVSCAGVFPVAPVEALLAREFEAAVALNLTGAYRVVQPCVAAMRERGRGHVVSIGSIADRTIYPENAAYAATKFGARALHEVLRTELRGTGVRTSLISPGPVDTTLWATLGDATRARMPRSAEMLSVNDVAEAVWWTVTRPDHVNVDELRLGRS